MTHPTEPRVEVTQADRAFMTNLFSLPRDLAEMMFDGEFDGKPDVASKLQMIATFRTAAEAANREREDALVALLTKAVGDIAAALELAGSAHLIGKWTADYVAAINAHDTRAALTAIRAGEAS